MKTHRRKRALSLALLCLLALQLTLSACGGKERGENVPGEDPVLTVLEEEPDTVDFQCTTIHYTVALNVFDRLVEMKDNGKGGMSPAPSLAESWEVSDDGRVYTFRLRDGVTFSNGQPLTATDVAYTFTRLFTHPDACNQDILQCVEGAQALARGETDRLEGLAVLGDLEFSLTLTQPFEAFLACLSMPGASILDRETTRQAGDFGLDPAVTVGTGPYVLTEWTPGKGMRLTANPACWSGPPACPGLDLRFVTRQEDIRRMFENGELDILCLDDVDGAAEYYIHGDIYQDRLVRVPRIAITYIALNESLEPLTDPRVRRALQLGLDRQMLLEAVYGGRGSVENGIYPRGLYGYNPGLPPIPYDPEGARELLAQAGYPDGLDLIVSLSDISTRWEADLMELAAEMWAEIGVRARVEVMNDSQFMRFRKAGELSCYTATWTADYDDPDNFIYTFFGTPENTRFRSLCYPRQEIMDRVRAARTIPEPLDRLTEYRDLERIIVQEDAAWIPLFSRERLYVLSERVEDFSYAWNGSVKNNYSKISLKDGA